MQYKAILWDLDGTLLDTLCDLTSAVNAAMTTRGYPTHTMDEVRAFVGNGARRLIERAVPPDADSAAVEATLGAFNTYYAAHCHEETAPYAGLLPLLSRLKAQGVRLGVVSNKPHYAVQQLAKEYFGDLLELAVGSVDGIPHKPAPDMVTRALQQLGVAPAEALYIGDSDVDVETARRMGMDGIFVTWGFRTAEQLKQVGARHTVDTVEALEAALCE